MNKTIKNHKVNFSPSKVLNRNKIIGGNLLNDAFTNIYLDGSSSSISSINISSNYLSSKKK